MPNGNPDFDEKELPKLEKFFAPIADTMRAYARERNLALDKYYHQSPSWDFSFRHPKGGTGKIDVEKIGSAEIRLICYWWYDDYEKCTRFFKNVQIIGPIKRNPRRIINKLNSAFELILSWQFGDWDDKVEGYNNWKDHWKSKSEFEMAKALPLPRTGKIFS